MRYVYITYLKWIIDKSDSMISFKLELHILMILERVIGYLRVYKDKEDIHLYLCIFSAKLFVDTRLSYYTQKGMVITSP